MTCPATYLLLASQSEALDSMAKRLTEAADRWDDEAKATVVEIAQALDHVGRVCRTEVARKLLDYD